MNHYGLSDTECEAFELDFLAWQRLPDTVRRVTRNPQPAEYATRTGASAVNDAATGEPIPAPEPNGPALDAEDPEPQTGAVVPVEPAIIGPDDALRSLSDPALITGLSERARLMCSMRGRMELAALDRAERPPPDPWRDLDTLHGFAHKGYETVSSLQCLEALGMPERTVGTFLDLTQAMVARGWQPWRVYIDGQQARGFRRKLSAAPVLPDAEKPMSDVEAAASQFLAAWRRDDPQTTKTIEDAYLALCIPA